MNHLLQKMPVSDFGDKARFTTDNVLHLNAGRTSGIKNGDTNQGAIIDFLPIFGVHFIFSSTTLMASANLQDNVHIILGNWNLGRRWYVNNHALVKLNQTSCESFNEQFCGQLSCNIL